MTEQEITEIFNKILFNGYEYLKGVYPRELFYKINNIEVIINVVNLKYPERKGRSLDDFLRFNVPFETSEPIKESSLMPYKFTLNIDGVIYTIPKMEYNEYSECMSKIDEIVKSFDAKNVALVNEELDKFIENHTLD